MIRRAFRSARRIGPLRVGARVVEEVGRRSRLAYAIESAKDGALPTCGLREAPGPLVEHWRAIAATRPLRDVDSRDLVARAEAAAQGRIRCFGGRTVDFGNPVDWHRDPLTGYRWPLDHYSLVDLGACDPKWVWEASRFGHACDLARAYVRSGTPVLADAFWQSLESWEGANPFRHGIHWRSGQEVALRALAWLFSYSLFTHERPARGFESRMFCRLLYRHGVHLAGSIRLTALTIPNNHVIAEAVGLAAIAAFLGDAGPMARWRGLARRVLDAELSRQFAPDGGYWQCSHTYHRMALQLLLVGRLVLPELQEPIREICERSLDLISGLMMAPQAGRLPNWGPNDGTMPLVLSEADYLDFRPIANALARVVGGGGFDGLPDSDPGREEALWLVGDVGGAAARPPEEGSRAYESTGLVALRGGSGGVVMRVDDRFGATGHSDLLHADVWLGSKNVALDAGSFSYFHREDHDWATGTRSHNTIRLGGVDHLRRLAQFTWSGAAGARLEAFSTRGSAAAVCELDRSGGGVVRRQVDVRDREVRVADEVKVSSGGTTLIELHWLLADGTPEVVQVGQRVTIDVGGAEPFSLEVRSDRQLEVRVERAWSSPTYGVRKPALSVTFSCVASSAHFVSTFEAR